MSDEIIQNNSLTDEDVENVSGGGGRGGPSSRSDPNGRCHRGITELSFPEKSCKDCNYFDGYYSLSKVKYGFHCKFFDRTEYKAYDPWD